MTHCIYGFLIHSGEVEHHFEFLLPEGLPVCFALFGFQTRKACVVRRRYRDAHLYESIAGPFTMEKVQSVEPGLLFLCMDRLPQANGNPCAFFRCTSCPNDPELVGKVFSYNAIQMQALAKSKATYSPYSPRKEEQELP